MIVRQPLWVTAGLTNAETVNVLRSRLLASGIVTQLLLPLKLSAPPYLPVVHVVPLSVPPLPEPEASATVPPDPSLKPYAATRPLGGGWALTVTVTAVEVCVLPAASRATAVIWCWPAVAKELFQLAEYGDVVSSEPTLVPS